MEIKDSLDAETQITYQCCGSKTAGGWRKVKIKTIASILISPSRLFSILLQTKYPVGVPDRLDISLLYLQRFGRRPNLTNPLTFNEKLLWLTLNDRNPLYTIMADKYMAKEFIAIKAGASYVIPNYGCWNHVSDITFDNLPSRYVLKCDHDSGSVIVCKDRKPNDSELRKLEKAFKRNYFCFSREWPYKNINPVVFAEKCISCKNEQEGIIDYKFYCFDGDPAYCLVISYRSIGGRETFFDNYCNVIDCTKGYKRHDRIPDKPEKFDEMMNVASVLSKNIPFLRVDMFIDEFGDVKVGELTLTPSSGLIPFSPTEYDTIFGEKLRLRIN